MTVALDAFSEVAELATTTHTWNHTTVSATNVKGVVVFVVDTDGTDTITGVTYGGSSLTEVNLSPNIKTTGEDACIHAYFLGASVPQGASVEVVVTGSASSDRLCSAYTVTAADDTEITDTDDSINSDSIVDPSGTLSLGGKTSFAAISFLSGHNSVSNIVPSTGWTGDIEADTGVECAGSYSYDTIGSTDITAGWTQTGADATAISVAINEVAGAGGLSIPIAAYHQNHHNMS